VRVGVSSFVGGYDAVETKRDREGEHYDVWRRGVDDDDDDETTYDAGAWWCWWSLSAGAAATTEIDGEAVGSEYGVAAARRLVGIRGDARRRIRRAKGAVRRAERDVDTVGVDVYTDGV
jgi:hypothetical protein